MQVEQTLYNLPENPPSCKHNKISLTGFQVMAYTIHVPNPKLDGTASWQDGVLDGTALWQDGVLDGTASWQDGVLDGTASWQDGVPSFSVSLFRVVLRYRLSSPF